MFNVKNMKIIFLALLLACVMPVLCMADGKGHHHKNHGTRVNAGAHIDFLNGGTLRLVVQYLNPSSNPVTIKEIRVYRPDGSQASPNFAAAGFPVPPFDLGPFEARGFALIATGVQAVTPPPLGVFQVHADWESGRSTHGLKSVSVVVTANPASGVVSKIAVEGFDIKDKKKKDTDSVPCPPNCPL